MTQSDPAGVAEAPSPVSGESLYDALFEIMMLPGETEATKIARNALHGTAATAQAGEVERECQAVWRCAIFDATTVIDMLKNLWLNSRRKHEREAGAMLSAIGDLVWAARGPAAKNYEEAFKLGKALTERARTALASGDVAKREG